MLEDNRAAGSAKMISVIVPVYNQAEYLRDCLDSLVAQTIPKEQLEVLLINDGSTDGSEEICREYCAQYSYMTLHSKPNEGLSATRNYGLRLAKGKYLLYLDSDDSLTPKTAEAVSVFFEEHQNEVELVGYLIRRYKGNRILPLHFRYRYLKTSGVYDLNEFPYALITTMNYAVKNRFEQNVLFDVTPDFRHEDQKYACEILKDNLRIGYCAEGEYRYNKNNENSIVSTKFYACNIFESTTAWYEELFGSFSDEVPPYFQALFLHDLNWKLQSDILLPYHYDSDEFVAACERLRTLLRRVGTDVLLGHPAIRMRAKIYFLRFCGKAKLAAVCDGEGWRLLADGIEVQSGTAVPVVLRRQRIKDGKLQFLGFIDCELFSFCADTPCLFAEENGELRPLDTFLSANSYIHPMLRAGRIFAFRYEVQANSLRRLRFFLKFDGWQLPCTLRYYAFGLKQSRFKRLPMSGYVMKRGRAELTLRRAGKLSGFLRSMLFTLPFLLMHPRLVYRRVFAAVARLVSKRRIWLYNDLYSVEIDNGYLQFQHDFNKQDGIRRYYVYNREYADLNSLFTPEQQKHLIKKGSEKHYFLYLRAERLLSAFFGLSPSMPFLSANEAGYYEDFLRFENTYLQHGVLAAALHKSNHAELCLADQIVVSCPFEYKNYQVIYNYLPEQLVCCGMARFDTFDRHKPPENRILLAPSWRKYLTNQTRPSQWEPVADRIKRSDYYKGFLQLLEHPQLQAVLEAHDLHLDVKLHPILSETAGLFETDHPRIHLIHEKNPPPERYKAFVTDFSSYQFDFSAIGRPVQCFIPDYVQFRAGMNHYRALDLPEDARYYPLATDAETAAQNLCNLIEHNFAPEEAYANRMDSLFFPLENCAEGLYRALTE
jgi:glycosyltransferase involved in cell wall biosynthesis